MGDSEGWGINECASRYERRGCVCQGSMWSWVKVKARYNWVPVFCQLLVIVIFVGVPG